MNRTLEHILPKVQKPARYTGGEYNAVVKDKRTVDTRFALCFPDTYEIGMSNLGCRILYGLMNEQEGLWCERCYAPWRDMEEEMRREGLLLYALESGDPISDFDIIGFSLGYEMAYTCLLYTSRCEVLSNQILRLHEKINPADLNQFLVEQNVRVCGLGSNEEDIEKFFLEKLSGGHAV